MMWRIPCQTCGGWFCLYEAERLPQMTDLIAVGDFRTLDGTPVDSNAVIGCFTCGANQHSMTAVPLDWVPVET